MTSKTIWLINQYASTPTTGMGGRHYCLARELAKQGHNVTLVAASYSHILRRPTSVEGAFKAECLDGIDFIWLKTLNYASPHSKERVFNWFRFAWKILQLPKITGQKPDAILFSSPAPFGIVSSYWLAKRFKARLVFEVRDIWPLTLIELGGFSRKHPFVWLMQQAEDFAYRVSTKVVSNLPNAVAHMVTRGLDKQKFVWIPNGYSEDELTEQKALSPDILAQLPKGKFLVGYTGTIGLANALGTLILAANALKDQNDIAFVVVGQGQEKALLQQQAKDLGLLNVIFIDPVNKNQMQAMLKQFDVCYIGWKDDNLYQFGIAANKLTDYLVAAKPILHSYSGAYDIAKLSGAGFSVPAEQPLQVADAIMQLKSLTSQELAAMGQKGKLYAEQHHNYANLAGQLANVLLG